MTDIYRSTIPGDESTRPVKTELSTEERDMQLKVAALQLQISQGAAAQLELASIRKTCKHHAFVDMEGFPYDTRYCAVCGTNMGIV